jgi:hypothetical protein
VFVLAGLYNLAWGAASAVDPQWYFRSAGLEPINHPEIFACLGMVIGLYGLLYLEVARVPERGFALTAVGLLGKILGPLGAAVLVARGTLPGRFLWHLVGNDLVWWIPFGLYLRDSWPLHRAGFGAPAPSRKERAES